MGTHGRDYLTGRVRDLEKAEGIRIILAAWNPYHFDLRLLERHDYWEEAKEIAEQIEGRDIIFGVPLDFAEFVIQVTLYNRGLREWVQGRDLEPARKVRALYEPQKEE